MSHFIRQLHIMSSLKSSSESEKIFPFYKALAPVLYSDSSSRSMHTQTVSKNIQLKTEHKLEDKEDSEYKSGRRSLAVVVSWMLAKGSHLDKYCKIYLNRGFDVLTVSISPQQMLFPTTGSQVVATNLLDYLEANKQYDKILFHAFSIGGYFMGEMFVKLHESQAKYKDFPSRVIGVVTDSAVDFDGIVTGFPRAVAKNSLLVSALELYMKSHLAVMYNAATKHYLKASKMFHHTPLSCPALMFVSEADKVGTPAANKKVANNWEKRGVNVSFKCFEKSGHVSHMHHYKEAYVSEIDNFLAKLELVKDERQKSHL